MGIKWETQLERIIAGKGRLRPHPRRVVGVRARLRNPSSLLPLRLSRPSHQHPPNVSHGIMIYPDKDHCSHVKGEGEVGEGGKNKSSSHHPVLIRYPILRRATTLNHVAHSVTRHTNPASFLFKLFCALSVCFTAEKLWPRRENLYSGVFSHDLPSQKILMTLRKYWDSTLSAPALIRANKVMADQNLATSFAWPKRAVRSF